MERTRHRLRMLMNRPLADLRLAAVTLDGIVLQGSDVVAPRITTEGETHSRSGLWEGSTENAVVASALLPDRVDCGLDGEQGLLFVIDGSE